MWMRTRSFWSRLLAGLVTLVIATAFLGQIVQGVCPVP